MNIRRAAIYRMFLKCVRSIVWNKCNNSLQLWGSPNTVVFWHQQWSGRCTLPPKIWPTPFNSEMAVIFHWNIDHRKCWFQWLSGIMLSLWSSGKRFNSRLSNYFLYSFNHGRDVFLAIAELLVIPLERENLSASHYNHNNNKYNSQHNWGRLPERHMVPINAGCLKQKWILYSHLQSLTYLMT